jgi:quinol monooxygenase YgiN
MAIIVAGRLTIKPGRRDEFVARSIDAVEQARAHDSCEDFSVSADPVDSTRVNIFEKWQSRAALDAFRNAGPESDLFDLVESFDTNEYDV